MELERSRSPREDLANRKYSLSHKSLRTKSQRMSPRQEKQKRGEKKRKNARAIDIAALVLRGPHPVQEVFLPSRWAATEMKISHLNFFAFVPPFGC